MKTLLRSFVLFLSTVLFVAGIGSSLGTYAWAANDASPGPAPSASPSPDASPSPSPSSTTVTLNPDDLRALMISGNPSLIAALNQVDQAKDQVRVARNDLLPVANLSTVLGTVSGPAFILSAVEFLVPFLIPSNWFNYEASQQNFDAEMLSYKILELNEYASVYALYETVVQDESLLGVLQDQANDWNEMVAYLQGQNAVSGTVPQADIESATASADSATASVEAMQQLIVGDMAQLRYALGLPINATLVVDPSAPAVPASQFEGMDLADASAQAVKISPEVQQLNDLIAASGSGVWSDIFAFVGTPSFMAGNPYSPGGSVAPDLSTGQFKGSFDFGFAAFPQYSLDQDKIAAIQISLNNEEIPELTETLESTLSGVTSAKTELAKLQDAEDQTQDEYQIAKFQYDQGDLTMTTLLQDRDNLTSYATQRANAQGQLDQMRITLERTMLEGEFSKLPGCLLTAAPSENENVFQKIWDAIRGVFSGTNDHVTLDQVCRIVPS